jgi:hypothetical protein
LWGEVEACGSAGKLREWRKIARTAWKLIKTDLETLETFRNLDKMTRLAFEPLKTVANLDTTARLAFEPLKTV